MQLSGNENILVIQTAYLGDLAMTLPMVQVLKKNFPNVNVDILCLPDTSNLLDNNKYLRSVIKYDKRGSERGILPTLQLIKNLKKNKFDIALIPHPSFRSAAIAKLSKIKIRIGFETSGGKFMFNHVVKFDRFKHEVERNISLLEKLEIHNYKKEKSEYFPSEKEKEKIKNLIKNNINDKKTVITIAPGSVWNTKRWHPEKFAEVINYYCERNILVFAIGGKLDEEIGNKISSKVTSENFINLIGKLSLLESIELIKNSDLIISNDSAPLHISSGVNTPCVGIYGPTDPKFGFWPYGESDIIIETKNLSCRPCGMHGADKCPIGTWECMEKIYPQMVIDAAEKILSVKKLE